MLYPLSYEGGRAELTGTQVGVGASSGRRVHLAVRRRMRPMRRVARFNDSLAAARNEPR